MKTCEAAKVQVLCTAADTDGEEGRKGGWGAGREGEGKSRLGLLPTPDGGQIFTLRLELMYRVTHMSPRARPISTLLSKNISYTKALNGLM